jgi:hypothetical protein
LTDIAGLLVEGILTEIVSAKKEDILWKQREEEASKVTLCLPDLSVPDR